MQEGILAERTDPLRTVDSMFDRFAAIFHAFSMLREHVVAAIEAGREKEAVYRLGRQAVENLVLPPLSVGEMTLRLYGALNYSQNRARDLRCALNGA